MNRWLGSSKDSERQSAERSARQARRTISRLPVITSDSEEELPFEDCNTSANFINLDGAGDLDESTNSIMPDVNMFQDENGVDDDGYYKKLSQLQNRMFNTKEPEFWFTSIETSLKHYGVKYVEKNQSRVRKAIFKLC